MSAKLKDPEYKVLFALNSIQTEQFATIDGVFKDEEVVNIQSNLDFGINKEFRVVGCFAKFQFEVQNQPFIIIGVNCNFEIEPSSWESFIDKENKSIVIPRQIMCHLAVLTVGTARGVLHAKTENTPFNRFLLPTINVTEQVKEDMVFML